MGSLNAAHASANARLHAAPGSRVGLIAQYEEAVLEGRELSERLERLERRLDDLYEQAALPDADPQIAEQIERLERRQRRLERAVETAARIEAESLVAAANKELNDEVVAELNALLGIQPEAY
ncbi:hypothetical protein GCM10011348_38530 [Marinobacterium nitratireducens]|uniref:Uncharacterized protein n=1 Tax=Marinobacterium nitratireducens TaxID=518897 RepID=A0A918DWK0_9GAMM|nr:hypothetical protein GCM10011348_38530 [Marinobacterium nitratireducens]